MLGGARDDVVPRAQMQELWAIIRNRGRDAAASEKTRRTGAGDKDKDENKKGEDDGPGPDDPKVPPRVVKDGVNTYIEFGAGTHNDTCVQPGYWSAVAEFVTGLPSKVVVVPSSSSSLSAT